MTEKLIVMQNWGKINAKNLWSRPLGHKWSWNCKSFVNCQWKNPIHNSESHSEVIHCYVLKRSLCVFERSLLKSQIWKACRLKLSMKTVSRLPAKEMIITLVISNNEQSLNPTKTSGFEIARKVCNRVWLLLSFTNFK